MKKKLKLKNGLKKTPFILMIITIILIIMIVKGVNNFKMLANDCDNNKGYTCTYYEIRQYSLRK